LNTTRVGQGRLYRAREELKLYLDNLLSALTLSSVFIGLVSSSVAYFSFLLFNVEPNFILLFASFCVTFSLYNINKFTDKEEDLINIPERGLFIQNKGHLLLPLSVVAYITALIVGGVENLEVVPILLLPILLGMVYSVKISSDFIRLKDIFIVKNILATVGWVLVATLLPLLYRPDFLIFSLAFLFMFIKLFINAVVFDVRDMEGDTKSGVKTIPATIGLAKTKKLLLILNTLLIPWIAAVFYFKLFLNLLPILLFSVVYGYWYILHFCKSEKKFSFSYDLLVDGEWMILSCMFIFLHHFAL